MPKPRLAGPLIALAAAGTALGQGVAPPEVLLGRPTAHSVTLSVLAAEECDAVVEVAAGGAPAGASGVTRLSAATPAEIVLDGLDADREYRWSLQQRAAGAAAFAPVAAGTFHTARPPGSTFTFAVQADPHLDANTDRELLARSLANVAAGAPDFLVDLGDSFMSEKFARSRAEVVGRHLLLRSFFAPTCASAPLFLVLGNHEGETTGLLDGEESLPVWATAARKAYFPNPEPDAFYSGDGSAQPLVGSRQSVYAWEWGDALLLVLDPYWFTPGRPGGEGDNWVRTLGYEQYSWLRRTLAASRARFKLVFVHNLVGGLDTSMRGGAEAARFYEWGGSNADGSPGFAAHRPGWGVPIHRLLVEAGVAVVFHGHDHFFARQELDGVVYQEVPQPGWPGLTLRDPGAYGYADGVFLPSSGHLRVTVSPSSLTVAYVKAYLAKDENDARRNGEVAYAYTLPARQPAGTVRRQLRSVP